MDLLQTTMDRFADKKTSQRMGLMTVFFKSANPFCVSPWQIRLDLAMFLRIFIPMEASRMKGMSQRHTGWV